MRFRGLGFRGSGLRENTLDLGLGRRSMRFIGAEGGAELTGQCST